MAISVAPSSLSKPPAPSVIEAVTVGVAGSVILIIWTPSSRLDATRAYVAEPIWIVVTPRAPSSVLKPPAPSVTEDVAVGFVGSVILIICTPSSLLDATRAYVAEPILTVVTLVAPSSSSNVLGTAVVESIIEDATVGAAGFDILIIWMPSSGLDVARAYVLELISTVATSRDLLSVSNVLPALSVPPSVTEDDHSWYCRI